MPTLKMSFSGGASFWLQYAEGAKMNKAESEAVANVFQSVLRRLQDGSDGPASPSAGLATGEAETDQGNDSESVMTDAERAGQGVIDQHSGENAGEGMCVGN